MPIDITPQDILTIAQLMMNVAYLAAGFVAGVVWSTWRRHTRGRP